MQLLAVSLSLLLAAAPDLVEQLLRFPVVPPPAPEKQAEVERPSAPPVNDPWADATIPKLISEARKAHEEPRGWIIGGDALEALARRDWAQAEAIARRFATSPQPRLRTLAKALLYAHATGEEQQKLHEELKAIATQTAQPGRSRDQAIEALMARDWPGRDEWLVALMHDPTLGVLEDGDIAYEPIGMVVGAAPDRLIPLMVKQLESSDAAVRSAAVN